MWVTKQTIKFINKIKRNTTNILSILICPGKQSKRPCLLTCLLGFHDVSRNVAPRLKTFSPNMNLFYVLFTFDLQKAPVRQITSSENPSKQLNNVITFWSVRLRVIELQCRLSTSRDISTICLKTRWWHFPLMDFGFAKWTNSINFNGQRLNKREMTWSFFWLIL